MTCLSFWGQAYTTVQDLQTLSVAIAAGSGPVVQAKFKDFEVKLSMHPSHVQIHSVLLEMHTTLRAVWSVVGV